MQSLVVDVGDKRDFTKVIEALSPSAATTIVSSTSKIHRDPLQRSLCCQVQGRPWEALGEDAGCAVEAFDC